MDVDADESPLDHDDENMAQDYDSENLLSDDMDEPGTPVEYESQSRKPLKNNFNIKQGQARKEPKFTKMKSMPAAASSQIPRYNRPKTGVPKENRSKLARPEKPQQRQS